MTEEELFPVVLWFEQSELAELCALALAARELGFEDIADAPAPIADSAIKLFRIANLRRRIAARQVIANQQETATA